MLQIFRKKSQGFTLIELLVVIAVIGMLASIVLVSMGPVRKKARDARRRADFRQVITAQEMVMSVNEYYFQHGDANYIPEIKDKYNVVYFPKTSSPPNKTYKWMNNTGDANKQKFCVKVQLEETGKWLVAAHCGVRELSSQPNSLDACCQ